MLRKRSLSERQAGRIVISSLLEDTVQDDVFSDTHPQRERSKSFSGPPSSRSSAATAAEDSGAEPPVRRHNSLFVPRRRGTKVVVDFEATPSAPSLQQPVHAATAGHKGSSPASRQLAMGAQSHDRSSVISTMAVAASPPGSLGSEVPSAGGEEERPLRPMLLRRSINEPSRPTTAASQTTSRHSLLQQMSSSYEGSTVGKRRRSNNFFRGDIKSSKHQLHKASIVAAQKRQSKAPAVTRRSSQDSIGNSSQGRLSWGSLGGPPGAGGDQSAASLGSGSAPRSRQSSVLERLRAGLNIRRIITRQSSGELLSPRLDSEVDTRASMATDIRAVLGMSGQVLEAASASVRDDYQRRAIQAQLGGDDDIKRVAWMNRVLGSLYVDDGLVVEDEDDSHKNDVIFHPNSPFRARWDILIVLVIIYQVAVMPVRVVWGDNEVGLLFFTEMLLSVVLMIDVALSFHTGWENDGDIIMDKHRVRRHYLLTWFVPELISSLPYDILAVLAHEDDRHSYRAISLRAIRFLGLLRWPRLWRYIQKWQDMLSVDSIIVKLLKYWLGLIMLIHTFGCLIALQAFLQHDTPDSFFNRTNFTSPPGDPPALMDRGPFIQYSYALFRSTSGLLACGWGMSYPTSLPEVWMMLVVQFAGSMMQLVFQAAILTLVRTYDRSTANYLQRMEMVKDFFSRHHIPKDVRKRTLTQLMARHTNRRLMRDDYLLKDMTPSMRVDLQQHLAANVLRLQPIFSTWRPVVVRAVAAELQQGIFAPGDTIFFKGEMADCMYFVAEGVVRIVDPDTGKLLTNITKGSYFGEFALLQGERGTRTASAEAASTALLFSLSRKTFYRIAAHYPEMMDSLNIVAAARAAVNSNQAVSAGDLLRIKNMRASFLMNTCRAAVAQAILEEEDEEEVEGDGDEGMNPGPGVAG